MDEYIKREDAISAYCKKDCGCKNPCEDPCDAVASVMDMPAADVAPVVHGRWVWITEDKYRCNKCGRVTRVDECMEQPMYLHCPYCGAKMDWEE